MHNRHGRNDSSVSHTRSDSENTRRRANTLYGAEPNHFDDDFACGGGRDAEMTSLRRRGIDIDRRNNSESASRTTESSGSGLEEGHKISEEGREGKSGCVRIHSSGSRIARPSVLSDGDKVTRSPHSVALPRAATTTVSLVPALSMHLSPRLVRTLQWACGLATILLLYILVFGLYNRYVAGSTYCPYPTDHSHRAVPDDNDFAQVCMHQSESILGEHYGVVAFTKCDNAHFVEKSNYITIPWVHQSSVLNEHTGNTVRDDEHHEAEEHDKRGRGMRTGGGGALVMTRLYSGLKWECVEYARRYWMLRGSPIPASFDSIDGAADMWTQLAEVNLQNGSTAPLHKYGNAVAIESGGSAPAVGDLIIYERYANEMPYGHVSVVVQVDMSESKVYVAEANWASKIWPGPYYNYSRIVQMKSDGTSYELIDAPFTILGWMRYN